MPVQDSMVIFEYLLVKAKAAALPKFSDTLTLSQPRGGGADYAHPLALPCLKNSVITPLSCLYAYSTFLHFRI